MRIISRAEWGARYARGSGPAPLPAKYLYLHHSVTIAPDLVPPFDDDDAAMRALEAIGEARFGAGISYTFAAMPSGRVYEGHGIDRKGTHTGGLNTVARAICAVGNYDTTKPPPALLQGIAELAAHGVVDGWWPGITGGHRDAPGAQTACPGRYLYAAIPEIRRLAAAYIAAGVVPPPVTHDPPDREELLMAAALDDNDARKALIRQWMHQYLLRGPVSTAERDGLLWTFATKGADACLAEIVDTEEAEIIRVRKRVHVGLVT